MRRNKKNFGDNSDWKSIVETRKYDIYKTQHDKHDTRRNYQSSEKVKKLAPLNDGSRSKRALDNS